MSVLNLHSRHRLRLVKAAVAPAAAAPSWRETALVFAVIFAAILVAHAPLLSLPYFWDEAGYYIPAAHDLLLTGDPIPHSTAANPHPPLVIAGLALAWKIAGFAPVVTRLVMLLWTAFALTGLYQLARRVAPEAVALATVALTALYPSSSRKARWPTSTCPPPPSPSGGSTSTWGIASSPAPPRFRWPASRKRLPSSRRSRSWSSPWLSWLGRGEASAAPPVPK